MINAVSISRKSVTLISDLLLAILHDLYIYFNNMQIENKYGSYNECNQEHKIWLRDLVIPYVQKNAVLFTMDVSSQENLKCGSIPDIYVTTDFGSGIQ